jgi:hypothetical protein
MKIRLGFVSNSSSSSYTCDHCGETFSGWDGALSEFELVECHYGHICCEHHIEVSMDSPEAIESFLAKNPDYADYDQDEIIGEMRYGFPSEYCPLCKLEAIGVHDLLAYYQLRFGLNSNEVLDDIRSTFGTYEAFLNAVHDARRNSG